MTSYAVVGQNIKRVRDLLGITQEALANTLQISASFLSSVEKGKRNISLQYMDAIADCLGVSAIALMDQWDDSSLEHYVHTQLSTYRYVLIWSVSTLAGDHAEATVYRSYGIAAEIKMDKVWKNIGAIYDISTDRAFVSSLAHKFNINQLHPINLRAVVEDHLS